MVARHWTWLMLVFALACRSGGKEATDKSESSQQLPVDGPAWYRVELLPGGPDPAIPFFVWLPERSSGESARIQNGDQVFDVEHQWRGRDGAELQFPLFHTSLSFRAKSTGEITGLWSGKSVSTGSVELPLRATRVDGATTRNRFATAGVGPARDLDSVWRVDFPDSGAARLRLWGRDGGARGVLSFPSGNSVSLAGDAFGSQLRLSGFDGTSAYLLQAELGRSKLFGSWIAGPELTWREEFIAARDESFVLVHSEPEVDHNVEIEVPGIDLSTFRGKPLIVELAASWCISCKHAAPFLVEMYGEFHPRGLEMITVLYEFTEDVEASEKQMKAFAETYKIPWRIEAIAAELEQVPEHLPNVLGDFELSGFPCRSSSTGRDVWSTCTVVFPAGSRGRSTHGRRRTIACR